MSPTSSRESGPVFLSYSRSDRDACIALRTALEKASLPVFRDEDAIRVGDRWMTRLEEALQLCSAFVLLVGRNGVERWVGAEVQVALIRHLSPHEEKERLPIFPILLGDTDPASLPPFLSLLQATRWSPTEALPASLIEAVRARATRLAPLERIEGNPFRGLNAFSRNDAKLFFGRRKETLEAIACLGDQQQANPESVTEGKSTSFHRWLQIEGNSGAGKSSLIRAGMLPLIEQGALWARTGFEHWRMLGPMMPGEDPVLNLAEAFEQGLIADETKRSTRVRKSGFEQDAKALAADLRDFKREGTAFLLLIDQFEELFTFAAEASRKQFDALLAAALTDAGCALFVISTVRADFLDRFEHLPRLQAIYNSRCKRYFLPTISEHGLREIVEQPARLAGLDVSEVTGAILNDARDEVGALPLVENALDTLWHASDKKQLSGELYRRQGGITGMLSARADDLLGRIEQTLPGKGRLASLELLLRLTRINDEGRHTRQRITREESVMVAGNGNAAVGEQVVRVLSGAGSLDQSDPTRHGSLRLITLSEERGAHYVDLIHETLIRSRSRDEKTGKRSGYWPTLYDYIEANRDRDIHRQELKIQAERWQESGWFGRRWNVAGWLDLKRYRRVPVPKASLEGRFLARSRQKASVQGALLAAVVVFVGESFLWTMLHDLPLDSMLMQQRYRFGYAPIPAMVKIPLGSFEMGEQDTQFRNRYRDADRRHWGAPVRSIEIPQPFKLGKHEVTYEQFDYFVWEQHRAGNRAFPYPNTAKGGRGTRPVVNINWHEATAYATWLGERTKAECRLPTEAEWEYAVRAGTKSAYWWGDEIGENKANCRECGNLSDGTQSSPVGSFEPNKFGLFDTLGNVWEWTCSAFKDELDGSERSCVDQKDGVIRAVRGGAWFNGAGLVRSSARNYVAPADRGGYIGFRVACSSPIE